MYLGLPFLNSRHALTDVLLRFPQVFANRFMAIAESMGRSLQQTSISTNIKERLDFSCALFGPEGGLVANAPVSV
jgi:N-methylhydantoinase B/oxoprolinase/acetone carboxylase alpha subunit